MNWQAATALTESTRQEGTQRILLDGQEVEWQLVRSSAAKRLRIKVGPDGIKVVLPDGRDSSEAFAFVAENQAWVGVQLERARKLLTIRRARPSGFVQLRGEFVPVRIAFTQHWRAPNKVLFSDGEITITVGPDSKKSAIRSLENWMRRQARESIEQHLAAFGKRIRRSPNRIYVMGQRTKWGNCSSLGNLSFNWRLIMAPDRVLRYIVAHEMVHLAVPDHSAKFWLTVQSLCPEAERAKQWLVANGRSILSLELDVIAESPLLL